MTINRFSLAAAAAISLALAGTASHAQDQDGLVNISVDDNTVQVPVSVAANVCDVSVDVLTESFVGSDETACEIDQETAAENGIDTGEEDMAEDGDDDTKNARGNGKGKQKGLVNLSVDGNTVQVPVGIAANVCDMDANVIAKDFKGSDDTVCEIDQETATENNIKM